MRNCLLLGGALCLCCGCATTQDAPPETIGEWLALDQVKPYGNSQPQR